MEEIIGTASPLAQLLEGIHGKKREQVDEAMARIRTLLAPTFKPALDGTSQGLFQVIRCAISQKPELACAINPEDGSLPLHHAASLGDIAISDLLLRTVRDATPHHKTRTRVSGRVLLSLP